MEHNFKRPLAGDDYEIKKRYDNGGAPRIYVHAVDNRWHTMQVQDFWPDDGERGKMRDFHDSKGWPKLRKHWKRFKNAKAKARRVL